MQQVRLWEVISNQELREISGTSIDFESRLEAWLESEISLLDPDLLVIGKQVRTNFGGAIDLLCLDREGGTVVIELKKGRTPREVAAQALDYASWVEDLSYDNLTGIAEEYLGDPDALDRAFQERFDVELPEELNLSHRSLIVAEEMDASTERIVRYLSDRNVPINMAAVHHFSDNGDRELLARVYLIEPEEAEAKSRSTSKRRAYRTLSELHAMADENGIGDLYGQIRNGLRGILSAGGVTLTSVGYKVSTASGGVRTVLIVRACQEEGEEGLPFTVHATRFEEYLGVELEKLRSWLPVNVQERSVSNWSGSSAEERAHAVGLSGYFRNREEASTFLNAVTTELG